MFSKVIDPETLYLQDLWNLRSVKQTVGNTGIPFLLQGAAN